VAAVLIQRCLRAKWKRKKEKKSGGKIRERRDGMGLEPNALAFRFAVVVGLVSTIKEKSSGKLAFGT
jgi:hypothetical protein